jgi:ribosomal protein L11 methyltransferase
MEMSKPDWVGIYVVVHCDAIGSLLSAASGLGFDLSSYEEPIENERAEDGYQVRVLSEQPVEMQFFAEMNSTQLDDRIEALRNKALSPPIRAVRFEHRYWDGNESVDSWKSHHTPIDIDGQLLLCPHWVEPPPFSGMVIHTAPGGAFGSGQHMSTATLCAASLPICAGAKRWPI